jgi:ATP-dependent Lon protease
MNVYEIDAPDEVGARRIAQSVYRELRDEHSWGRLFPEQLDDGAIDRLARLKPREMRRVMLSAFGNAKLAGRNAVCADDVADDRVSRRPRIGF